MFKQLSKNYFGYLKVLCDIHYIMLKYGRDKVNKRKKTKLVEYVLNIMEEKIETELSIEQEELIKSEKMCFDRKRKQKFKMEKLVESLEKEQEDLAIKLKNYNGFDILTFAELSSVENDIDMLKTCLNSRLNRKQIKQMDKIYDKHEKRKKSIKSDENPLGNDEIFEEMSTLENTVSLMHDVNNPKNEIVNEVNVLQNVGFEHSEKLNEKEEDTMKLNKIEEMEIITSPNNDLKEDIKMNFSFKQVPSMPVLKNFVLEGLQPVKIEVKEEEKIDVNKLEDVKEEIIENVSTSNKNKKKRKKRNKNKNKNNNNNNTTNLGNETKEELEIICKRLQTDENGYRKYVELTASFLGMSVEQYYEQEPEVRVGRIQSFLIQHGLRNYSIEDTLEDLKYAEQLDQLVRNKLLDN